MLKDMTEQYLFTREFFRIWKRGDLDMETREEVLILVKWELLFVFVSIIFLSVLTFVSGEFQSFFEVLPLMSLLVLCLSFMYYLQILRGEGSDG